MVENNSVLNKFEGLETRFEEISTLATTPGVIADQPRYVEPAKEYKDFGDIIDVRERYIVRLNAIREPEDILANETDANMKEMIRKELQVNEGIQSQLEEEIKLALVLRDPEDVKSIQMGICVDTGGGKAALPVGDLFNIHKYYCDSRGWTLSVTSVNEGSVGDHEETDFAVSGGNVRGTPEYESGVYCVQRVLAMETQGRMHTSTATVAVLPEADQFRVNINEGDIRWNTFRSSGARGQNANETEPGARFCYPWRSPNTGEVEEILIECTETRDQSKSKERVPLRSCTFIYNCEHQKYINDIANQRKLLVSAGGRNVKIHVYNYPQGHVIDHRVGYTTCDLQGFANGGTQAIIDALTVEENTEELKGNEP